MGHWFMISIDNKTTRCNIDGFVILYNHVVVISGASSYEILLQQCTLVSIYYQCYMVSSSTLIKLWIQHRHKNNKLLRWYSMNLWYFRWYISCPVRCDSATMVYIVLLRWFTTAINIWLLHFCATITVTTARLVLRNNYRYNGAFGFAQQ